MIDMIIAVSSINLTLFFLTSVLCKNTRFKTRQCERRITGRRHDAMQDENAAKLNVDSVQVPLRGTLKVALLFIPSALLHSASASAGWFWCVWTPTRG